LSAGLLNVTVLSTEVDAVLARLVASTATPEGIPAMTLPLWVIPDTSTV